MPEDPTLYFQQTTFGPFPEGSNGTAKVVRIGANNTSVTVKYQVASSTAYEGLADNDICANSGDFNDTSGTLSFQPGEVEKQIHVPLLRDGVWEQTLTSYEKVAVVLYDASGADIDSTRYIAYIEVKVGCKFVRST